MKQINCQLIIVMMLSIVSFLYSKEVEINSADKNVTKYESIYANFYFPNLGNANKLANEFGFDKIDFASNFAIEAKRSIRGSDWYFGAMLAFPVFSTTKENLLYNLNDEAIVDRFLEYSVLQAGFSLDRKFALYHKLNAFTGLTFGFTSQKLTLTQFEQGYFWNIDDNEHFNNFSYSYVLQNFYIQPHLQLLYQLIEGHHLRLEVGYVLDFLNNSKWRMQYDSLSKEISGAPKSNINGLTLNLGWSKSF